MELTTELRDECNRLKRELDAARKVAETAMFERVQLRMRVAELENRLVVEGAK